MAVGRSFAVACSLLIAVSLLLFNYQSSPGAAEMAMLQNQKLAVLPKVNNSMSDLFNILHAMESNIPFGFAHFNDGEMSALECSEGDWTAFSWNQKCSKQLNLAMHNAFLRTPSNFYLGIPCNCEFRGISYLVALKYLNISHNLPYQLNLGDQDYRGQKQLPLSDDIACPATPATLTMSDSHLEGRLTVATVFINGNFIKAKKELTRILNKATKVQNRGVHVVVAEKRKVYNLPFKVKSAQFVSRENAFEEHYETFRTEEFLSDAQYEPNDIVLIMAGPVGRILATEWGILRPDITFLEMGSFWDTELWSRPKHHLGISRACMHKTDLVGLSCKNSWVHYIPQMIPEGYFPTVYFC
jgi:hypothetical protein